MLTKEEYKKTFIRMMDSLRTTNLGSFDCRGVYDCNECPLASIDCDSAQNAFEIVETVEQWGKEHPIVTNADKFKEVFGTEPKDGISDWLCPSFALKCCPHNGCDNCKKSFWEAEYKEPKKSEE